MQITRRSWKAKDRRMDTVNELLQNIRFLKYYGWGQYIRSDRARNLHTYSRAENHWADKTRRSREDELKWRVKENTVDTLISFIWSAELGFHVDCRTKIDCRQSIHSHCALFQAARTYDSITRTGFCYASRYNQSLLPVGIGTLTRISSLCLHAAHRALSRRKRSSRMGIFDEDFGKRLAFCVKT